MNHAYRITLRHLPVNAKKIFCSYFPNARAIVFRPGSSVPLLRQLFRHIKNQSNIEVPFSRENAFCSDNEAFRFSALYKNGIEFSLEGKQGGWVSMRTLYSSHTPSPNKYIRNCSSFFMIIKG
jgi:hypothetical protein